MTFNWNCHFGMEPPPIMTATMLKYFKRTAFSKLVHTSGILARLMLDEITLLVDILLVPLLLCPQCSTPLPESP